MEIDQHVFSATEFHKELIDRFFHPKSYFFHCISYHLDCELDRSDTAKNEDQLLFGNLMDKVVTSNNKDSELEMLAQFGGFNKFYQNLISGIEYLRDSDLDPEQMKIEIESLAKSMVKTAFEALDSEKTKDELKQFLGIRIPESDDKPINKTKKVEKGGKVNVTQELQVTGENEESQVAKVAEEVKITEEAANVDTLYDINETLSQRLDQDLSELDITEKTESGEPEYEAKIELTESPSEVTANIESELTLENASDFLESDDKEEKDFLETLLVGTEASTEGGIGSELTEEGDSVLTTPRENFDNLNEQPQSIVQAFIKKIEFQHKAFKNALALLKKYPKNNEHWLNCCNIFDNIREIAMIYGFEDFEQIASKARNYIITYIKKPQGISSLDLDLLIETENVLHDLIQGDVEKIDVEVIKNLIKKLTAPKKREPEENLFSQDPTFAGESPKKLVLKEKKNTKVTEKSKIKESHNALKEREPEENLFSQDPTFAGESPKKLVLEEKKNTKVTEKSKIKESHNALKEREPEENLLSQDPTFTAESPKKLVLEEKKNIEEFTEKSKTKESQNENPIPQIKNNKISEFKLPGEDDDEFLNLVKEVTENNLNEKEQISQDLIPGESDNQIAAKENEIPATKTEPPKNVLDDVLQPPEDKLKVFKDEADLYFNVVDDALKSLELEPENKSALDDLELASYSLYGLTVKLDLEPLSKLPEAIEELVKNVISSKSLLSKKERNIIRDAYRHFRNLTRLEDIEKRQFKEIFASIQKHNSQNQNLKFERESTKEKATKPNLQFRLKSKSSSSKTPQMSPNNNISSEHDSSTKFSNIENMEIDHDTSTT